MSAGSNSLGVSGATAGSLMTVIRKPAAEKASVAGHSSTGTANRRRAPPGVDRVSPGVHPAHRTEVVAFHEIAADSRRDALACGQSPAKSQTLAGIR